MLPNLASLACQKYKALARATIWHDVQHRDADGFLDSIEMVYSGTSDVATQFRAIIRDLLYHNRWHLLPLPAFQSLVMNEPSIALDMLNVSKVDPFRLRSDALCFVFKCGCCGKIKECVKCESSNGGYLLPPADYEIGKPIDDIVLEWGYVCCEAGCGFVNEARCEASEMCTLTGGDFVTVDSEARRANGSLAQSDSE